MGRHIKERNCERKGRGWESNLACNLAGSIRTSPVGCSFDENSGKYMRKSDL